MTKIRLTGEWQPGRVAVYGTAHRIFVDGVTLVYQVEGRGRYMFLGVERVETGADGTPLVFRLGSAAVPRATYRRLYDQDAQRRSYYA